VRVVTAAPRVELTRVYHFSAGHRLRNPALSDEDNSRLYGACARAHGHNYLVEVTVAGTPDAVTGMVADLAVVDAIVEREVIRHVDHRTLEEVPFLAGVISTGESLARAFFGVLSRHLGDPLVRVTVRETAKNSFEYRREAEVA
jgi:6-pyruvoyltetrahydropterin/6-carboxytetrahydropterin synthase